MITIEHNVPIPNHVKRSHAWEYYKDYIDIMEVGHSFRYPSADRQDIFFATQAATFESDGERNFVTYAETPYIDRVWRTA